MTKTKRQQIAPLETLHKHFSDASRYGDRWSSTLYPALIEPTRYTTLYNRYAIEADFVKSVGSIDTLNRLQFPDSGVPSTISCYIRAEKNGERDLTPFALPSRSSNGIATHWNLDAASVLAASVLAIESGDRVLDLCAAPGGKSVALAQGIWPDMKPGRPSGMPTTGSMHSNESDRARFKRLDTNIKLYLPLLCLSAGKVKCLNLDGTAGASLLPLGLGGYDKVLLDAPCSSERHILQAQRRVTAATPSKLADELQRWSPTASKRMAETQLHLLLTAIRAIRLGGKVLYATCSISHEENDDVVEKALKYFSNEQQKGNVRWKIGLTAMSAELSTQLETWAERTSQGWIVLPDHVSPYGDGWGPLYFSLLTKDALP